MTNWLQTVWDWRLPKRYYLSMCLNGLQSCRLSNFFHFSKIVLFFLCIIFSYENSATYEHFWFFEILKVWQPVTLQPLEVHGLTVPFWKPPISHCVEPGGHGDGRTFRPGWLLTSQSCRFVSCSLIYIFLFWQIPQTAICSFLNNSQNIHGKSQKKYMEK